ARAGLRRVVWPGWTFRLRRCPRRRAGGLETSGSSISLRGRMARFVYLSGPVPYTAAHELQRHLLDQRIRGEIDDTVLLLEHAETITVGRSRGAQSNVLAAGDVPVVAVERGGDVTWHGPGQLVAYPIVQLSGPRADLHRYLRSLEQAVMALLWEMGLRA